MESIRSAIIDWLDDSYHFGDAEKLIGDDDRSLLDNGILDSLGYVNLTLFLEQHFHLKIDRKSLTRENFDSIRKIVSYIAQHPQFKGA